MQGPSQLTISAHIVLKTLFQTASMLLSILALAQLEAPFNSEFVPVAIKEASDCFLSSMWLSWEACRVRDLVGGVFER